MLGKKQEARMKNRLAIILLALVMCLSLARQLKRR